MYSLHAGWHANGHLGSNIGIPATTSGGYPKKIVVLSIIEGFATVRVLWPSFGIVEPRADVMSPAILRVCIA